MLEADPGCELAREKMAAAGVDPLAIDVFAHYFRLLERGETGMIPESTIDPLDMPSIDDVKVADDVAGDALRTTAVIKLNGGLGTSMGMERAKSLLCVRRGLSFLDIIARQVLHLRTEHAAPLPLIFMNSFRTSADTLGACAAPYEEPRRRRSAAGVPAEQGAQARETDLDPGRPGPRTLAGVVSARARRHLHRDVRLRADRPPHRGRLPAGVHLQLRQPRCGAGRRSSRVGSPSSGSPFAIESVRRTRLGPQGRPLRHPQERRPDRAARDRADPARGQGRARGPRAGTAS